MFIPFTHCHISVSGIPIITESASLTLPDNVEQFIPLGFQTSQGHAIRNQKETTISIDYIPEINNDPLFTGIKDLLTYYNANGFTPFPIVINNISGQFYIDSYKLSIQNGDIARSQVTLISYNDISGVQSGIIGLHAYNKSSGYNLISFFTTKLLLDGQSNYSIHDFDYSCKFNWQPTYIIGQNNPYFVNLMGGSEELTCQMETASLIGFSGTSAKTFFNINDTMSIEMKPLGSLWNGSETNKIELNTFGNGYITDYDINIQQNDYAIINVMIRRDF